MGGQESSVRTFVALELDPRLREAIGRSQTEWRLSLPGIRLVRPEGIHLTLRFLGATSPPQAERLRAAFTAAAAICPPCQARVGGLGVFPERGAPRILWLGIEAPPPVLDLQEACERAARAAGFEPEARAFRPHLTLGRWRERTSRPELPAVDLGATRLDALVFYQSQLGGGGAVYTPLERFPLGRPRS